MPLKYEVKGSKLNLAEPLYYYVEIVKSITGPFPIIWERGFLEPIVHYFYDAELDDGTSARIREEFGKDIKIGDLVHYNIAVDEFTKFDPSEHSEHITLTLTV